MRYAFTATQKVPAGGEAIIEATVAALRDGTEFTSGSAYGGDSLIARIVAEVWPRAVNRVVRPAAPCSPEAARWATLVEQAPEGKDQRDAYGKRNIYMLNRADVLVAFPRNGREALRSGTWWTVRMARKRSIPILVVPLDGTAPWIEGAGGIGLEAVLLRLTRDQ